MTNIIMDIYLGVFHFREKYISFNLPKKKWMNKLEISELASYGLINQSNPLFLLASIKSFENYFGFGPLAWDRNVNEMLEICHNLW